MAVPAGSSLKQFKTLSPLYQTERNEEAVWEIAVPAGGDQIKRRDWIFKAFHFNQVWMKRIQHWLLASHRIKWGVHGRLFVWNRRPQASILSIKFAAEGRKNNFSDKILTWEDVQISKAFARTFWLYRGMDTYFVPAYRCFIWNQKLHSEKEEVLTDKPVESREGIAQKSALEVKTQPVYYTTALRSYAIEPTQK